MPALKIYSPSRTEAPQQARRRVWTAPAVTSHAAVVLTPARLYLAPGKGPVSAEVAKSAEQGADLEQLFGPLTVAVNLPSVTGATNDLVANTIHIEYAADERGGTSRVSVTFSDAETADAVFSKLWRRLGEGWTAKPVQPDRWSHLAAPAAALAGVLVATVVLGLIVAALQDTAPGTGGIARLLDWRYVCGLGGVLAALAQVWLYRRATQPPERIALVRT